MIRENFALDDEAKIQASGTMCKHPPLNPLLRPVYLSSDDLHRRRRRGHLDERHETVSSGNATISKRPAEGTGRDRSRRWFWSTSRARRVSCVILLLSRKLISETGFRTHFRSQERLPYLEAVLKEVLRWKGIAPTAIPHRLSEDDIYRGADRVPLFLFQKFHLSQNW